MRKISLDHAESERLAKIADSLAPHVSPDKKKRPEFETESNDPYAGMTTNQKKKEKAKARKERQAQEDEADLKHS